MAGSGSKASVRIQFEYDLLGGKINDLSLNAFNDQDATDAIATVDLLQAGDLIIRDLAYVGLQALQGIIQKVAFYLCRLSPTVKVYERKGDRYVEMAFKQVRSYMEKRGLAMMEKEVYLGAKAKLKTRLVIHRLPAEEVEKRLRKAKRNNKKKGRNELNQGIHRQSPSESFYYQCGGTNRTDPKRMAALSIAMANRAHI